MNLDRGGLGTLPPQLAPHSLKLRIFNLSDVEKEEIKQKGGSPEHYISVEWQCPKMTFCGFSEKGEFVMQAWFLIPPSFLKHQAGPAILDSSGQPMMKPEKIQEAFFPYSLPTFRALIRKEDLSAEVPLPAEETEDTEDGKEED
jgi:hypothetical protein